MKKLILIVLFTIPLVKGVIAKNESTMENNSNKLAVLWTSGDPEVAEKMVFMYTLNAKKQGWFDDVVLIIWGPSAKLLTEDQPLQDDLERIKEAGVKVEACIACARMYGIEVNLAEMGIDVKPMGAPLSSYLKEGWKTLSF